MGSIKLRMKTEDKLRVKLLDPAVQAQLKAIKAKWGLNQNSYKSIGDFIKDERSCFRVGKTVNKNTNACRRFETGEYYTIRNGKKVKIDYQDKLDFSDEVEGVANNLDLPVRTTDMLMDYLVYKRLNFKRDRIGIGTERNVSKNQLGKIVLHLDPDIRLSDVKKEWRKVRRIQKVMLPKGQKNRSPKNMPVVLKSAKEKHGKAKYKTLDVIDDVDEKNRFAPSAAKNARQMKYRYKKI